MTRHDFSFDAAEELLTTKQAAAFLKVSPKTLERMRVEGGGPVFVKVGRLVRYRRSDLLAFIDSNVFGSTSEHAGKGGPIHVA